MFHLFLTRGLLLLVLCVASAPQARAQAPRLDAVVTGTALDADGGPLPGVRITLETPAGVAFDSTSGNEGAFTLAGLPPGDYVLRAFFPERRADPVPLQLAPGESRAVTLRLRVSGLEETIVVSASQVELATSTVPAAVTVFTAQDLESRQLESATDLLRFATGMTVARSGSRGGLTAVFPRGGESDYTLLLIDGVRMNAFGGGFDFSALPSGEVERLELVRGPQSAVFGSDAIGGVVHVVTRRGGPARAAGLLEGGSFGSARGLGSASGTAGAWSGGATAEWIRSDGFTGIAPGVGEPVTNDDYERTATQGSIKFARTRWNVAAHARRVASEKGYPGPFGSDPNDTFAGVDRVSRGWTEDRSGGVGGQFMFTPTFRARGSGSWTDLDSRFQSPYGDSRFNTRRFNGRLQVDARAGRGLGLSAGGEMLTEQARSTYIVSAAAEAPIERRVIGTFAEGRFDANHRLTASLGVRVEHIHRDALAADPNPFAPRPVFDAESTVSANPRASVSWFLREAAPGAAGWTRLRANAGTGIRPPDAFEIAFTDNPALEPERSRSIDVGVEQAFLDGRWIAEATWFWNRYDDLIVAVGRDFADASRFRTDNIANARAQGLETSLSLRPRPWLDVRAGYTWLDTEVLAVDGRPGEAPAPFEPGDPLIRRPRHQGWLEVLATRTRWSAFARVAARGAVLDVDPSYGAFGGTVVAPGFGVADVGASVSLSRTVSATARITNLFDQAYEEAFGFPSPGRSLIAGVRVASRR